MSTKLIRSLTDEKTDMQKQLGCMNGIFQLFGRATSHNHKRLPPGTCRSDDPGTQPNSTKQKSLVQRNISMQSRKEKKLIPSVDLSRTSCSSSCSSSTFSSADCNKTSQSEPLSSCNSNFPEMTSLVSPPKPPSVSLQLSRQPMDLHDIVKQSMYKPASGLSVKTKTKDVKACETIRQQDSPRPQQQDKHVHSQVNRRDTALGVMAKLQDVQWNAKDEKNGVLPLARRDAPRYSYDETQSRHTLKSTTKLKELPRLSLDSRERSAKKSSSEHRRNQLSRKETENKIPEILIESQEPGSNKKPSALVARLMGFEPILDSTPRKGQGTEMKSCLDEASETISPSLKVYVRNKQIKGSDFPKVHCKNSVSPRYKYDRLSMDSSPGSTFLLGREPCAQTESFQGSHRQSADYKEASTEPLPESVSVYSEIRKKLGELDFRKGGKDLRALEYIIEEIEKERERLGNNKNEDRIPYSESCTSQSSLNTSFSQASTQQRKCNSPVSPNKGSHSPKSRGTQVVNRQPTNVLDNSAIPTDGKLCLQRRWSSDKPEHTKNIVERRTTREIISRNNGRRVSSSWPLPYTEDKKISKPVKSSQMASQKMNRESPAKFNNSSQNLSPRLQQKYQGREKLPSFTTQSSDIAMSRIQSVKPPVASNSSTRRLRQRSTNPAHRDDRTNISTTHPKNISHRGPTQSENAIQLAEQIDEEREVESINCAREISTDNEPKDPNKEDYKATLEQPSPVSVLDITFYEEDIPSPVKKISTAFQDTDNLNSEESEGSAGYIDFLQNSRSTKSSFEFDQQKVDDVGHAVHKLGPLNTSQDKATTDHGESHTNPDHTYIAEILRSTGLLSDLSSPTTIQINPTGLSVNPDLFRVLEKDAVLAVEHQENSTRSIPKERVQRKLVFDAVSEILSKGSVDSSSVQNKMGKRTMTGEKLLEELCTKLDHQQATPNNSSYDFNDELTSIYHHESWTGYSSHLPGLVLDIERMIFKDLISEVANGEAFPQQNRELVST